jgi:hypothetical protein
MRSLIELPGLVGLDFRVDVGGDEAFWNPVQAHHRRIADGLENIVVKAHHSILVHLSGHAAFE